MDWINRMDNILQKIKAQIHAHNIDDCQRMTHLINQIDPTNTGFLSSDDFQVLLKKLNIFLSTQELRHISDHFGKKQVEFRQFLGLLRQNQSERRMQVVENAFRFLDSGNKGCLELEWLMGVFRAEEHPRVRVRDKDSSQVKRELYEGISRRSKGGMIDLDGFIDYYVDVSATLPQQKEEYFIEMIIRVWGVESQTDYISHQRLQELELILYEKVRQKTVVKEDEAKTLKKAFKYFDLHETGSVTLDQFQQTLEKFGAMFKQQELAGLFHKYEEGQTGKMAYDEFCNLFATMGSGDNPNVNPVFKLRRETPTCQLNKIRDIISRNGKAKQVEDVFSAMDKTQVGVMDRPTFNWGLKQLGVVLPKVDMDALFRFYDKQFEDKVDYKQFVTNLSQ